MDLQAFVIAVTTNLPRDHPPLVVFNNLVTVPAYEFEHNGVMVVVPAATAVVNESDIVVTVIESDIASVVRYENMEAAVTQISTF